MSRQGGEAPPPSPTHLLHPCPRLTSNAQGEVLTAAGLAKGIVGTAGVDATVLRAGWPEGQVLLLTADCVVALTIRQGAPILEPLVGGPEGPRGSVAGGQGGLRWPARRARIRGSGLDPSVYKWGN